MSQQARNNPDSPEMQRADLDNRHAVFAAKMTAMQHNASDDEETDEELLARFYDHVDDKYSLAARDARREAVDSGNHDFI